MKMYLIYSILIYNVFKILSSCRVVLQDESKVEKEAYEEVEEEEEEDEEQVKVIMTKTEKM